MPEHAPAFDRVFADLRARADAWFSEEGVPAPERRVRTRIDMRYLGQNYELPVGVPAGPIDEIVLKQARAAFDELHAQRYGYASPDEPVEAVTFRVEASSASPQLAFSREPLGSADPTPARAGSRRLFLPERGHHVDAPVYDRALLAPGNRISGPALIEQFDTTTLVLPGEQARVDETGNIGTTLGSAAR